MKFAQMHTNGTEANASVEANKRVRDDKQVVRNGVVNGGERGRLEENRLVKEVQKVDIKVLDPQALYPQPPFQVIHWEKFLHVRSLKVLLVENDDSTRHIVSALLRNCSYQVIPVSNGLQAWKILEDISIHIDIVLSEVVMPGLSGIGLLSKIMNHKTRKTTPVIMTSSHDSMGIVFKCLSNGAIDFLAKPIRKNELKNLWQHVWRKCHSSSGSGSESGVQNQKSLRSRSSGEDSENDSRSREEYDNRSIDLLRHDGSDNGSGTQSSWTKKAVDVESPKSISPREQRSDSPDSTRAQVIHSRSEGFASSWVPTASKDNKVLDGQCGENVATEKKLQRGSQNSLEDESKKSLVDVTENEKNHVAPVDLNKNKGKIYDSGETQVGSENLKTAELIGDIDSNRDKTSASKQPFCVSQNCKTKDEAAEMAKERPSLELTLKRVGDADTLRHSELSAFTRYPDGSAAKQTPTGNVGSCSPDAAKTETPLNQVSNDSSNNNDMGSTTYRSFTKPAEAIADCANPSAEQASEDGLESNTKNDKKTVLGQEVQVQHHYHHYHHHHHHVHCLPQGKQVQKRDEAKTPAGLECGSSGVVNIADCSGSNNGSNQNNAVDVEGTNMESDDWAAAPEGEDADGSGSGTGLDEELSAQKEASMNKICQKRKERCFDKRVRHQSRKKPAENSSNDGDI